MPKDTQELIRALQLEISQLEAEKDQLEVESRPGYWAMTPHPGKSSKRAVKQRQRDLENVKTRLAASRRALSDLQRETGPTAYDVGPGEGPTEPVAKIPSETAYDVGQQEPSPVSQGPRPESGQTTNAEPGETKVQPMGRKFTNRPDVAGREGWEYVPDEPAGPQYDINIGVGEGGEIQAPGGISPEQLEVMRPGTFKSSPSQLKEAGKEQPAASAGGRPPEGWKPTDYTQRSKFEDSVFQQIGGNPFQIDVDEHVRGMDRFMPKLFNHVFKGIAVWADRDKLNSKQQKFWSDVVKKYHADQYYSIKSRRDSMVAQYNWMMNRFDNEAKAKEAAMKKFQESRKAPDMRQMENEKGEVTWHKWDTEKGQYVDTGKRTLTESKAQKSAERQEYTDAVNLVKWIAKQVNDDEFAGLLDNPEMIKKYPGLAKAFGQKVQDQDPRMKELYDKMMEIIYREKGITGEAPEKTEKPSTERKVVETREYQGRKLIKYDDGSIEWAD